MVLLSQVSHPHPFQGHLEEEEVKREQGGQKERGEDEVVLLSQVTHPHVFQGPPTLTLGAG